MSSSSPFGDLVAATADGVPAFAALGSGPEIVLVHGLGGCHLNWMSVAPLLARDARVIIPDLPGFGTSPRRGRTTLARSRDAVLRLVDEVATGPVVLVGHSLGGAVAVMTAAARPDAVSRLVLVDPTLPFAFRGRVSRAAMWTAFAMLVPLLGPWLVKRRLRRDDGAGLVDTLVRLTVADPASVPADVVDAHRAFEQRHLDRPWLARSLCEATRSLFGMLSLRRRWFRLERQVTAPTLLLHGAADTVIPLATARAAVARNPQWQLQVLEGVGHAAPLEAPAATVEAILGGRSAGERRGA